MPDHEAAASRNQKQEGVRERPRKRPEIPSLGMLSGDVTSYVLGTVLPGGNIQRHAGLFSRASPEGRRLIARQLQQTYGNRYVQRLVQSIGLQAKLAVSQPDDVFEQEAERVAEAVTKSNIHLVRSGTRRMPRQEGDLFLDEWQRASYGLSLFAECGKSNGRR